MNLAKISFLLAVLGIGALFAVTETLRPTGMAVADITPNDAGAEVAVNGTIKSISIKEGNIFITLQEKDFRIVMFRSEANQSSYALKKGNMIEVTGRVQLYKGQIEIIAEKIRKME